MGLRMMTGNVALKGAVGTPAGVLNPTAVPEYCWPWLKGLARFWKESTLMPVVPPNVPNVPAIVVVPATES